MSIFERGRLDNIINAKETGDAAGTGLYWDPESKRIRSGVNPDPDRPHLDVAQSDLGHS